VKRLEKIVDLGLSRGECRLDSTLCRTLLAQMQLSHPAPLDFSELDYSLAILAQIANHLYDDLICFTIAQLTTLQQQHSAGARGERPAMGNDDHPDLEVIDDLRQQFVQHFGVHSIEVSRRLIRENDVWIHGESTGNGSSLLLSTRQLARSVCHPRAEPNPSEKL
jgi:hypothetical protein